MFVLAAGVGTVALWLRSMNWPLRMNGQDSHLHYASNV
jgi:hypothetical protein